MAFLSRENLKAILADFKTKITANIASAKSEAISTAATDAQEKANAAKDAAIQAASADATSKADAAKQAAIEAAANDATTKADAAKSEAIEAAKLDATTKADAAKDAAIADAKAKADKALEDAKAYANELAALELKVQKVEKLPEVEEAKTNIIYFVPKAGRAVGEDIYDEFILIDGKFELIGTTAVSLDGYATESWVTGEITKATTEMTSEEIQAFNTELWS